ncbi:hypothetical protein P9J83_09255 [Clostridium sporogenes]|uniref:Uncharacterized protein n=1 Tax=Clostridium sporogenes TaxID=1509 RepID=A0AAE4FLC8_CLOSG|nr:hypothetical protein [Clostridium sporogenes]MDS1003679.1 hypothetical protein [Clostridium sporogenes]
MFNFRGVLSIKKDGEIIYENNEYCKLKGEETSCKKFVEYEVKSMQEVDI